MVDFSKGGFGFKKKILTITAPLNSLRFEFNPAAENIPDLVGKAFILLCTEAGQNPDEATEEHPEGEPFGTVSFHLHEIDPGCLKEIERKVKK